MNQERNLRRVPARPIYICCIHGQKTQNSQACKNYQNYQKEIFPCCMHTYQQKKFLICLHLYIFYILLVFNAFQISMLLGKYIICSLLPTNITIPCAVACIVYWQSTHFNPKDKDNCFIILAVCGIDIVAEILKAIVPRILVCQELIFIGGVGLFWMRGIVLRKAECTAGKSDRLDISVKKQQVITINKKYLKNEVQKCCICLVKTSNYIVLPCMHKNYCQQCVNRIDNCSLCRKPISEKINYSDYSL